MNIKNEEEIKINTEKGLPQIALAENHKKLNKLFFNLFVYYIITVLFLLRIKMVLEYLAKFHIIL